MNNGVLELKEIKIFARHGCFEEERKIGNWFIVDFRAEMDVMTAAMSDSLDDAVNYQIIFDIVKEEMEIPSNLLENVAYRILKRVKELPRLLYHIDLWKWKKGLHSILWAASSTMPKVQLFRESLPKGAIKW